MRAATVVMAVLLAVSSTLLVWASTLVVEIAPGTISWQGVVDVVSAFGLVILGALVTIRANPLVGRSAMRLAYGVMTVVAPLWLVMYALPAVIAVWRPSRHARIN
jgi:hypothetical protein